MARRGQQPHALLIPIFAPGHWPPLKDLLYHMVDRRISFTILGSKTEVSEAQVDKDMGKFEHLDHVELVEVFDPEKFSLPLGHAKIMQSMRDQFYGEPSFMERLIAQIADGTGPTFIVSDMFLSWTQELSEALGIPRYAFFPSPCAYALIFLHGSGLLDRGVYPESPDLTRNTLEEKSLTLPGLEKYRVSDLPASLGIASAPALYQSHLRTLPKAAGLLLNDFEEMHVDEASALRRLLQDLATDSEAAKVYFIGPQLLLSKLTVIKRKHELATQLAGLRVDKKPGCLQFLDSQPAASVLYINFGSLWEISETSISELARGLEESGTSFLWILRSPKRAPSSWNISHVLPEGFEARTNGRGLVCNEWAPQKEILCHPSVGGFLSHCGWNSTLEAMCSGIPIICWPCMADQHLNARLLVSLRAGLEMKKSANGDMVRDEVAMAIQKLMVLNEGTQMRRKMQELKIAAITSTNQGGSSYGYLQGFLQEVTSFHPA